MQIQVLSVAVGTKMSAAGKAYQNAEIAFKNLDSGKVESKNISQYSKVFKQVADAISGQAYSVLSVKNEKTGYWDWESFTPSTAGLGQQVGTITGTGKTVAAPKSNFETPEERAKRQVYIVKQSSISAAVELLKHNNPKGAFTPNDVMETAQKFVDWVFAADAAQAQSDLFDQPSDDPF